MAIQTPDPVRAAEVTPGTVFHGQYRAVQGGEGGGLATSITQMWLQD
ncbi:hypothetical protein [Kitasatospora sp. NPDC047058]